MKELKADLTIKNRKTQSLTKVRDQWVNLKINSYNLSLMPKKGKKRALIIFKFKS